MRGVKLIITNGKLDELKEILIKKGYKVEIGELNSIGKIKIICLVVETDNNEDLEEIKNYDGIIEIIAL